MSRKFKSQFILFTRKVCSSDISYFDVDSYGDVPNETLLLLVSLKQDSVSLPSVNSYLLVNTPLIPYYTLS
jgi:hypothetical protein